jgi:hypothetical protein
LESIPGLQKRLKIRAQSTPGPAGFNKNGDGVRVKKCAKRDGVRVKKCANPFVCSGKQAEPHMNSTQRPLADLLKQQDRREIIVRGQSCFSRLPKYLPPIPLSARRVCPPPATKAGGTHSPGGEGDGGQYFGRREK